MDIPKEPLIEQTEENKKKIDALFVDEPNGRNKKLWKGYAKREKKRKDESRMIGPISELPGTRSQVGKAFCEKNATKLKRQIESIKEQLKKASNSEEIDALKAKLVSKKDQLHYYKSVAFSVDHHPIGYQPPKRVEPSKSAPHIIEPHPLGRKRLLEEQYNKIPLQSKPKPTVEEIAGGDILENDDEYTDWKEEIDKGFDKIFHIF